jgi:hypothetical protein
MKKQVILVSLIILTFLTSCSSNDVQVSEEPQTEQPKYFDTTDYILTNENEYMKAVEILSKRDLINFYLIIQNNSLIYSKNDDFSALKYFTKEECDYLKNFMDTYIIDEINVAIEFIGFRSVSDELLHYFYYDLTGNGNVPYMLKLTDRWYYGSMANR